MHPEVEAGRGAVVGRFAPSPSGPLHFGSLVAALGSCLSARSQGGQWLLRIEDVDTPRCVPGAAEGILRTLERCGFEWEGPVVWQSARGGAYRDAFERLQAAGRIFGCACTRKEMADSALARDGTRRYPGTCRDGLPPGRAARAYRLRVPSGTLSFDDRVQGTIAEDVAADVGDFVLLRADGLFAYQLAVVVDDAEAGVTEVVRGADLLDSTCRQILLQRLLGYPVPAYAHLPVACNVAGEKLSKQTLARTVDGTDPARLLVDVLDFLGQRPPADLAASGLAAVWAWGLGNWSMDKVPRQRTRPAPGYA
ncbi:tRNA glutamyl-Q(34) synthetase GluQRS [Zoogloea sp. LCSB751]|uniref:tRNA glutamyl-Q(34) synthetase GluQRS n=1 Tax=Zoogloea sp. LCSB751 TaxID=1965277 RepID=UPI0009A53E47|nr:tRNA glutamyl-Q(34) synthetase GluQRS [Zoogloea sp. LCSB751]